MNSGIQVYNQVTLHTGVNDASPHRLIQMLLEAALEKISEAKEFMANKNIWQKGENISMAISLIEVLQASLDMQAGGELAKNLEALYGYMTRRLTEANLKNDIELLDEITNLLLPIKQAWDSIPEEVRVAHQLQTLKQAKEHTDAR